MRKKTSENFTRYFRAQNIDVFTSNYETIAEEISVEIRQFIHRQSIINSRESNFTKLRFTYIQKAATF